jgi:hypothetical protein
MNPAILARLFQAHADAVGSMQGPELQQEPGPLQWGTGQGAGDPVGTEYGNDDNDDNGEMDNDMNTETAGGEYLPGVPYGPTPTFDRFGLPPEQGGLVMDNHIDLGDQQQSDPGAMQRRSSGDMALPPSDYKYLDRNEGHMGVMFGQDAGEPTGNGMNVPMSHLPPGAHEGQYISPMDIHGGAAPKPPAGPMGGMFNDPETAGVQWGPNPYPQEPPPPPMHRGRRMTSR